MATAGRIGSVGRRLGWMLLPLLILPAASLAAPAGEFSRWLDGLRREALAEGIAAATLERALSGIVPLETVIAADRRQPEFERSLDDYLAGVIDEARVRRGRVLLERHRELFNRLALRFQVPPRILVALWGIESGYGRFQGEVPVIRALATLAQDDRRSDYFRAELLAALHILDEGELRLEQLRGSWAGAMGQLQFMPSSFRRYALDWDGDGRRDIFASEGDVLASAANYLAAAGWQPDQRWGREVRLPADFDPALVGAEQRLPVARWRQLGIRRADGGPLPPAALPAALLQPDGPGGRAFLVYDNYRVLLRWNRSRSFALAVGLLADRIQPT